MLFKLVRSPLQRCTAPAQEVQMRTEKAFSLALGLCLALLASPAANSATIQLRASLNGAQEVPANVTPATGTGVVTFDTVTRELTWAVSYSNLQSPINGAGTVSGANVTNVTVTCAAWAPSDFEALPITFDTVSDAVSYPAPHPHSALSQTSVCSCQTSVVSAEDCQLPTAN